MSYFSAVPDAINALVAMLRVTPALSGVEITDGPPLADSVSREVLCIGYSPAEDTDAVDVTAARGDLGSSRDREQFTVHCSLGVLNGDRDTLAARTRAYALLDAAGFAIAADTSLRKTVMNARLGSHSLRQSDTNTGLLARINFDVDADAFTGR
jgi:hypothetical protein